MKHFISFACGALFAIGLGLSGMTQPSKVMAFLDMTGAWDPTLALVMGGALTVTAFAFPRILRHRPLLAGQFALPTRRDIDTSLVVGAVLFGVGWGLAGYCPGPALVSLATGTSSALTFVGAMMAGLLIARKFHTE